MYNAIKHLKRMHYNPYENYCNIYQAGMELITKVELTHTITKEKIKLVEFRNS